MAKKDPENQNPDYAVENIDPKIEAKIDAMMNPEAVEKAKPTQPEAKSETKKVKISVTDSSEPEVKIKKTESSTSLLPDEKLPDFEKKDKADEKTETKIKPIEVEDKNPVAPLEPALDSEQSADISYLPEKVDEAKEVLDEKPEEEVITPDETSAGPEAPEPAKIEKTEVILSDEIGVEDRATEAAVDDIIAGESDRLLAIDDAKAELTKDGVNLKKGFLAKIKTKLKDFWANPTARRLTIGSTVVVVAVIFVVPVSRYFTLNLVGIRASTSLRIVDEKTGQPLKNAKVSIDGKIATTDINGQVSISKIKLGAQTLSVNKPAFADLQRQITFGWGSNPIGDFNLTAVGSRYLFSVKDFFSDRPVDGEAVSGQYSARADKNGEIVLVIEDEKIEEIKIAIVANTYRTEELTLLVGNKDTHNLKLVPARKHAFVSKRDGRYDLYKIDADGKNEQLILKGTGKENQENMVILPHKTKEKLAFVSTRGGNYNKDGFAFSSLNIIDLGSNEATKIAESERIQLIDFIEDKLVFVKIKAGESQVSPKRHQLISYDIETRQEKELASTNYFNDVLSARGIIYYSPAEYKVNGQVGFYQIKPDGSQQYTIFAQEVWNLFRVSYFKINASVGQKWYGYDIGSLQFNKLEGAPPILKSRVYVDAPHSPHSIWVDERDGKGALLLYNTETNAEDKILLTKAGLRNPIRWLDDDHIVYRVTDNFETADFIVSISGGEPKKIIDVTNIAGLDRWYYY